IDPSDSLEFISKSIISYLSENEKFLNICNFLNIEQNTYFGDINNILDGKKLKINDFETQTQGIYLLNYDKFMSVIQIMDDTINYTLNKVEKC
ncbi:MAG: tRNA pseudouridine(55) synthase TruB, partial [Campylobacter concisus]|nr:tRNA pseudouridine(55) synthase TruB [Campylobacter concisus]